MTPQPHVQQPLDLGGRGPRADELTTLQRTARGALRELASRLELGLASRAAALTAVTSTLAAKGLSHAATAAARLLVCVTAAISSTVQWLP